MTRHIPLTQPLQTAPLVSLTKLLGFLSKAQPQPDKLLASWGFRIDHPAPAYTELPDQSPSNFYTVKYIITETPEDDPRWDEPEDASYPPYVLHNMCRVSFPTLFASLLAQVHAQGEACDAVGILANALLLDYPLLHQQVPYEYQTELITMYLHYHWQDTAPLTRAFSAFLERLQRALNWESNGLRAYNDWDKAGRLSAAVRLDERQAALRLSLCLGDVHYLIEPFNAYLDTVRPSFYNDLSECVSGSGASLHSTFENMVLSHNRLRKLNLML